MTRLVWDQGAKPYEAGVDRGVFYPPNGPGEVWNGLVSVQESSSDANERVRYLDGLKTRSGRRPGDFAGAIEAFTYPDSFHEHVLSQRRHPAFSLCYRVKHGDSHQIHLVYNVLIGPTSHIYDQDDDLAPFSWDFTTIPVNIPRGRPSAHLVIDTGQTYSAALEAIEEILYGSELVEARLPKPEELFEIFEANAILRIIDHGDGTWTAIGPDEVISMIDATTFQIDYPTAVYISSDTYTIHSW